MKRTCRICGYQGPSTCVGDEPVPFNYSPGDRVEMTGAFVDMLATKGHGREFQVLEAHPSVLTHIPLYLVNVPYVHGPQIFEEDYIVRKVTG
ncbi:MAG: hypothetical protein GF368_04285 [Candidatus Aenigmarchaeota archaeon]|nr:hypothetical protein [Candidatus Aenigmarchaeota archaeon]